MFYSQFILAKKGPLGTIWIAAHLERKLKKNQVADTDIGVSVDSILFPEVPIALRLSSHLLLGVVRIYSRKVNYLFHDCSEALLKVKQAFRSTAVDLPPEESTAPYHSITLPETFDLDDFELPDSALLSGNFDDRHVSTREQITLQDTLDGTEYSTSQFRLDERFGDGDASQISLDLDEELLLENNLTLQDASVLDGAARQGQGATILVKMVIEEGQYGCDEDKNDDASKELSELLGNNRDNHVVSNVENVNRNDDSSQRLIFNIQTPDLNEVFLPDDHIGGPSAAHDMDMDFATADPPSPECDQSANFPSTPGLSEEAIRANFHELPDSNPQKISTDLEVETHDTRINQEAENLDATNGLTNAASTSPKSANLPQVVSSLTSVLAEPNPDSVIPVNDDGNKHDESKSLQSANSVPVVSSSTSVLTEINPSPAAESLGGTLAGPDVPNNINLLQVESTDSKQADISQVLPSSTLVLIEPVSDSLVPPCSGETITASGIDGTLLEDTTKLSNLDQDRVGDSNSCQTGNFSALSSDFHLRSCTSESSQANLVSPCDVFQELFQERTQEFSFRGQPCNAETPLVGQQMHFSESSMYPQGLCSAIATDTNIRVDQKSDNIPVELSSNCISKDVQSGNCNYFSSSEFTEPERMRFAVSENAILSNYLGQQATEKGVTESDGSVDRISNLSGQKRRLLDITPDLQNGISPKMSGIPQKKRNNDYIPNDDDLLASILVGRGTPALRIGSTPPLPKPPSFKRPRLTAKAGLPKRRKVLLDDTIVLHADAIRQQLINTDDIRRMRKKAPCTRPEIWRIQKISLEDDIFCESIFTGISKDLNTLLTRRYDLAQNVHSQISGHGSSGESAKEVEHSKSSVFVGDADDREMAEQNAVEPKKTVDGEMQGPLGTSKLIEAGSCKNALSIDAQERLESPLDLRHDDLHGTTISRAELDTLENTGVEMVTHSALNSENECGIPTDSRIEENRDDICTNQEQNSMNNNILHVADGMSFEDLTPADCAAGGRVDTSLQVEDFSNAKAASITVEDMGVDIVNVTNLDGPANVGKDDNGGTSVSMLDRFIVEVGADFPADSPIVSGYANASVPSIDLVGGGPVTSDQQAMDPEAGKVTAGCETVVHEERPLSEVPDGEKPDVASFSILPSAESECVPSAVGENSSMNIEGGVDVEGTPMEFAAARESSDFCSAIDDIDTDFLNVDDEVEYDEETNNDEPNNEEAQSLENSGWSSRTRGVARYLKNLFDQESGGRRKSVAIDHLLAGKSRKEASRMFFETLVLKTRDYIHVEQENPFDCVNIKPRIKLLKSEF